MNVSNTVMSKRKVFYTIFSSTRIVYSDILVIHCWQLNRLVTEKWVDGWDDPRMLTLAGLRRRGFSSTAINSFVRGIGITRRSVKF